MCYPYVTPIRVPLAETMRKRPTLTTRGIGAIRPQEKRQEIPDGIQQGLYLVVQISGKKSWALRYRHGGRPRKHTLGKYPALSLSDARKDAAGALELISMGRDPTIEKKQDLQQHRSRDSLVENVLDLFIQRHVKVKTKPSSASETTRLIEADIKPMWRGRTIGSVGKSDIIVIIDAATDRGAPYLANRLFAALRKFFNWCVERGLIQQSPMLGMRPPTKEVARGRVLSNSEISHFLGACEQIGWPWGPLFELLLLTGQRRNELASAKWREFYLDDEAASWTIPAERTKNSNEHVVQLSPHVARILRNLYQTYHLSEFVFSTNGCTAVSGFSRAKARLDAMMQASIKMQGSDELLTGWRLHDLRRTAASGMASLGHPVHVVEATLNHRSGTISGIAAVYNRYDYAEEKRRALSDWSENIEKLKPATRTDNVIPIRIST